MTVRLCNAWARVAIMCICGIVPVRYEAPYWKGLNINSRVRSGELLTNDRFLPTPPYARPYTTLLFRLLLSRLLSHCFLDWWPKQGAAYKGVLQIISRCWPNMWFPKSLLMLLKYLWICEFSHRQNDNIITERWWWWKWLWQKWWWFWWL